jgi:hypothetical protein
MWKGRENRLRLCRGESRRRRLRLFVLRKTLHFLPRDSRNCRRGLHLQVRQGQDKDLRIDRRLLRSFAAGHFASGYVAHALAAIHRHLITRFSHCMLMTMHFAKSVRAAEMLRGVPGGTSVRRIKKPNRHQAEHCCPSVRPVLISRRHDFSSIFGSQPQGYASLSESGILSGRVGLHPCDESLFEIDGFPNPRIGGRLSPLSR